MAVKVREKNGAHGTGHAPVRAALYARVSTEEQSRRESIETQIHYARQQCEREGIPLGQIYKDEGVSGTVPFESRPGGKQLLADARAGKFETVLLYKVDWLGRSDVVSHIARHHLETLGVGLRSLTEPFDTSTPHGRFMFSILSANSAMERENIRERSRAGLYRVASQGRWACGRPPYGYRLENQRLVPDEEEAKILRRIFQRAVKRESLGF
jgi:site-specific DNA recombinase